MKTTLQSFGRFTIVRDDLRPGGTKTRFLAAVMKGARHVTYAAPFCGGAPVALAVLGAQLGVRVTLFYAQRATPTPRQRLVKSYGAEIRWVPMGYMTHLIFQAKRYADRVGAKYIAAGVDVPEAQAPFIESLESVRRQLTYSPDEIWCATSSGMLTRCLALAFPDSHVRGVGVGLKSHWGAQKFPSNVSVWEYPLPFANEVRVDAPFPIDLNYEAKAWQQMILKSRAKRALFWNVIGSAFSTTLRSA